MHKILHKAVKAMETKRDKKHNKLIYLEDTTVMFEVYNTETLEKLINTIYCMHNTKKLT